MALRAISQPSGAGLIALSGRSRRPAGRQVLSTRAELMKLDANPLMSSRRLSVFDTKGKETSVADLTSGLTVFALISWEQAANLYAKRAALDAAGARLVVIGAGTPSSGKTFCEKCPFPEESLFVDPERKVYAALQLYEGLSRTFFDPSTPAALQKRGLDGLREGAKNYTMIPPINMESALQQGGVFVFDGSRVLYAWRDGGTGDHAPLEDILGALPAAA